MLQQHDLLAKYDVSGPRYTSYPTAAQFENSIRNSEYIQSALQQSTTNAPLSLYIHIPFCRSLCHYCACNKVITKKNANQVRPYLDHLHKEMALIRLQLDVGKRPVVQLHWGGGTPTFLDIAEMTELMHLTATYFDLSKEDNRDFSVEIDPRTVNEKEIYLLHGIGFNRISLGVQDFDSKVQKAIHRVNGFELIENTVNTIRKVKFKSLNFDLIYGLPFQTERSIRKTLEQVIRLSPDRISYYNYAHLPHRFPAQRAIMEETLPGAREKVKMLSIIIEELTQANYLHIGMDHFVKPGDGLALARADHKLVRNFQGYTVNLAEDIIGLGVSAISSLKKIYVQNQCSLDKYYQFLERNKLPVGKGLRLSDEDLMRREIIQQLLCYRNIKFALIEEKYQIRFSKHFASSLDALSGFIEDGILLVDRKSLIVPPRGIPFLRNIAMAFDAYLCNKDGQVVQSIQYSKVL